LTTTLHNSPNLTNDNTQIDFTDQVPVIAHGDSWFSLGALIGPRAGNMLQYLSFPKDTALVSYAAPMLKLVDMVQHNKHFINAMTIRGMPVWRAILISGGGNDLFEALKVNPTHHLNERILRTSNEWTNAPDASRYLSDDGWKTLTNQLMTAYLGIDALRKNSVSPDAPIVTHIYDYATPRPAGLVFGLFDAWLYTPLLHYGIPQNDWIPVVHLLLDRFKQFLLKDVRTRISNFHVINTSGTLTPAAINDSGKTAHWANEVHPNPDGYERLANHVVNPYLANLLNGVNL